LCSADSAAKLPRFSFYLKKSGETDRRVKVLLLVVALAGTRLQLRAE
jgi:hypothetical protein